MTHNELRRKLTDLKLFLDDLENRIQKLVGVIYELEDKICDAELQETFKF
jgi:hypothetical protein